MGVYTTGSPGDRLVEGVACLAAMWLCWLLHKYSSVSMMVVAKHALSDPFDTRRPGLQVVIHTHHLLSAHLTRVLQHPVQVVDWAAQGRVSAAWGGAMGVHSCCKQPLTCVEAMMLGPGSGTCHLVCILVRGVLQVVLATSLSLATAFEQHKLRAASLCACVSRLIASITRCYPCLQFT